MARTYRAPSLSAKTGEEGCQLELGAHHSTGKQQRQLSHHRSSGARHARPLSTRLKKSTPRNLLEIINLAYADSSRRSRQHPSHNHGTRRGYSPRPQYSLARSHVRGAATIRALDRCNAAGDGCRLELGAACGTREKRQDKKTRPQARSRSRLNREPTQSDAPHKHANCTRLYLD